jgi:hypothetical protein
MGLTRRPQNRFPDIPDPCCDPSAAELNSRALGPVQTVYESLNRYISLGGSDHINRQQTGPGLEIRVKSRCNGDHADSRKAANQSKRFAQPAHQKREEDSTDEFPLAIGRNSCLVFNFSTYVSSLIFVNQTY